MPMPHVLRPCCRQVYPVFAHWSWSHSGWLNPMNPNPILGMGAIDFAGSGEQGGRCIWAM